MTNKNMLGLKLYKTLGEDLEDTTFEVVRIVKIYSDPDKVAILKSDGNTEKTTITELANDGYTILDSKGVLMFSIVTVGNNKDVVVSLVKKIDMALGNNAPCVICRQSVTDFFYNIIARTEEHEYVGISASDKTCPANIEYGNLLLCDSIEFSEVVNVYLDDTIDTVMQCVNITKYDEVLSHLYEAHVKAVNNPLLNMKSDDKGWCKTLKRLLYINNFWVDYDAAFNITDVDFDISKNTEEKKDANNKEYIALTEDAMRFLSGVWFSISDTKRQNISDSIVLKYDYDIDLGEYKNENYVLVRDNQNVLYLIVYTIDGEYFEADLAAEKESLSRKFGLKVINKYKSKI